LEIWAKRVQLFLETARKLTTVGYLGANPCWISSRAQAKWELSRLGMISFFSRSFGGSGPGPDQQSTKGLGSLAIQRKDACIPTSPFVRRTHKMASEVVQRGREAWDRLKCGSRSWDDWLLVGVALIEARAIAMRNGGTTNPAGPGYAHALNRFLLEHRLNLPLSDRAKLLVIMGRMPEIERWRATLSEAKRSRINSPGAMLANFRKATAPHMHLRHER
jgi:hypothetical protein